ncbi:MAG: double-strand break repair protein AddB [Brevundimonas sp.]|uniref:double-strand break repair protein AddB n=1 Tax=Brevundimonas sp. TaxID=1871086 RepID=UPI0025C10FFB|nr:double-strand break repair protein AddB [Brevundimonas sp.]MBX3478009.1 double-strand break repair protein AddB [Brevundimonas sp.]
MSRFDPFDGAAPRWWAIASHRPFLKDLAFGLLDWLGPGAPEALSDAVVLLPNRRAARDFTRALARTAGERPVLLPQVRPLGDLQEDEAPFAPGELGLDLPPAIAPLTRRFEMARMIVQTFDDGLNPARALDLAEALGGFMDSCAIEEVEDLSRIADLAERDLAEHWRDSARFLGLAVEAWPARLQTLGLMDGARRRTLLLRRLAELWDRRPPEQPVIVAGSTGAAPAVCAVLAAVARAPRGCVVLPGLDLAVEAPVWDQIGEQHPQGAMKRLLAAAGVGRGQVRAWPRPLASDASEARGRARGRVLNEALRPPAATSDWLKAIRDLRAASAEAGEAADPVAEGLAGLSLLSTRTEEDAASAIALMMRETLETPGATCALVTPDQGLGRRVQARLERWGVVPDNSAGSPLARHPAGTLVDLCARWLARPTEPQLLLGLVKHPLVAPGLAATHGTSAVRALERHALRGPSPRGWRRIHERLLRAARPGRDGRPPSEGRLARLAEARSLIERLEALHSALAFSALPLDEAAHVLTRLVEDLATVHAWAGLDGEAAAALLSALIDGGAALGDVAPETLADLVEGLLRETVVRGGEASHPSLRILGVIEGALVRADRMILAGLEEGVWPAAAETDPLLSRSMRAALGLPPPERRLGQAAHAFVQAAAAPDVVLVHSERRGGQPAVRSRWLWRLQMLTRAADDPDHAPVALTAPEGVAAWTAALDAPPPGRPNLAPRPLPRPPVERRPRSLYVTGVERWVRDPYSLYARRILNLEELERPGAAMEAMARGQAIHAAIERFTMDWPDHLPEDCEDQIRSRLLHALHEAGFEDADLAREGPLAANCARWLAQFEQAQRARGVELLIEQTGALTLALPVGDFTLKARADRIELSSTGATVMDFKTGAPPSGKQMRAGLAPQLTLTAAIVAAGGFEATRGPVAPEALTYVRVIGRTVAGEVAVRAEGAEAAALADAALEGLKARIARFDDPATPYASWMAPQFMGRYGGGYDRLARVWEWAVAGSVEEGE